MTRSDMTTRIFWHALLLLCCTAAPIVAEPADTVEIRYRQASHAFLMSIPALRAFVDTAKATPANTRLLRRQVVRIRNTYKGMEYLVDYAHPGSSARLNPAPLDRADMTSPDAIEVLPPEGLQILLETAFENNPLNTNRTALVWQMQRLKDAAEELDHAVKTCVLDDRMLFEAMQNQVIRVLTTGITGFDTPATQRALPESRISLESLRPTVALYLAEIRRRDAPLARRLVAALDASSRKIPLNANFNTFDRLTFLRETGNPLYAALVDAQRVLGIATFDDLVPIRRPVRTAARNLFDPEFLDPYFYSLTSTETRDTNVIALGRKLFFDPVLSSEGQQSCASCHDPRKAFSDGTTKSPAFGGGTLPRNAPSLTHAAYQSAQFWDLRAGTLEDQIQHVFRGRKEFNNDFLTVLDRLQKHPEYPEFYRTAFGRRAHQDSAASAIEADPVTLGATTKALAQYLRSLNNWNSSFDRYVRGETQFLDPAAKRGFNLFMGKAQCAMCHFPPTFGGTVPPRYVETESEVIGVPESFPAALNPTLHLDSDLGRGLIHQNSIFRHAFKTPTVRNAALTAPYMHNGGMNTLDDVLDFYNAGGGQGLGLDVPNQTLPSEPLGLTRRQMRDVISFMNSLTDTTGFGTHAPKGY
jgi:cytochrome c peroxidase